MAYIASVGSVFESHWGLSIKQYSPRHSSEVRFEREMMMCFPEVVLALATEGLVVVLNLLSVSIVAKRGANTLAERSSKLDP